jgi:carbon storage regulator
VLIISRHVDEAIILGGDMSVTVGEIAGDRATIRFGYKATGGRISFNEVREVLLRRDEICSLTKEVEVSVVDIRGDKVRIGIQGPKTMSVHRKEVYDAIRGEDEGRGDESDDIE